MENLELQYNGAFGHVKQEVTRNNSLSLEAKGIYCYLASFCGEDGTCFPSLETILKELNIGKNRFYKYIKELEDAGILKRQKRNQKSTIYTLVDHVLSFFRKEPVPQIEEEQLPQIEAHNNNIINNNNNTIDNSIDYVDEQSDSNKYLNQNKFFSRKQKEELFYLADKDLEKAKELEKTIFATKKIAIKDKQVNFKELPIIDWIRKIKEYASRKKVVNKSQYLFSALVNEFKEYLCPSTNNSYKAKSNKKVIVPEWELNPKKEIKEATEEEKAELLAQLAALRAK